MASHSVSTEATKQQVTTASACQDIVAVVTTQNITTAMPVDPVSTRTA
jgi:hypothetical protein